MISSLSALATVLTQVQKNKQSEISRISMYWGACVIYNNQQELLNEINFSQKVYIYFRIFILKRCPPLDFFHKQFLLLSGILLTDSSLPVVINILHNIDEFPFSLLGRFFAEALIVPGVKNILEEIVWSVINIVNKITIDIGVHFPGHYFKIILT